MHALDALGNPVRRAILARLRESALSPAEIAERFPVTRLAISRHLRILMESGWVDPLHARACVACPGRWREIRWYGRQRALEGAPLLETRSRLGPCRRYSLQLNGNAAIRTRQR